MPSAVLALPCGSRSMTSTVLPACASAAATLTVVVVLPTPPFWFATVITRVRGGRGTVRPLRVIRLRASAATAAARGVCPSAPGIAAAIAARTSVSSCVGASMRSSRGPAVVAGSVLWGARRRALRPAASPRGAVGTAGVLVSALGGARRSPRAPRCLGARPAGRRPMFHVKRCLGRATRAGSSAARRAAGNRGRERPCGFRRPRSQTSRHHLRRGAGAGPIQPHGASTRQSATASGGQQSAHRRPVEGQAVARGLAVAPSSRSRWSGRSARSRAPAPCWSVHRTGAGIARPSAEAGVDADRRRRVVAAPATPPAEAVIPDTT